MIEPIYDTGSVQVSTDEQRRRGWHDYRRQVVFKPGTTKAEAEAFTAGLKAAEGLSMWFNFTIGRVDGATKNPDKIPPDAVVLDLKFGYDSGD